METCSCLTAVETEQDFSATCERVRIHRAAGTLWTLRVRAIRPARITCVRGTIWITMEGCPRDIVLAKENDSQAFQENGKLVVQALANAVFDVSYAENAVQSSAQRAP